MRKLVSLLTLGLSLIISACSAPDETALAKGDDAFKGQMVDGQLRPVAARSVMVGTGGRTAAACAALATPKSDQLAVHWSNDPSSPVKVQVEGEVWTCETDGAWTGVIFPAADQSTDDCSVTASVRTPREYQGPCRWGWALTADLAVVAG
ncbi:MAG: hypothetical protein AABZ45_09165 [Pseudomonadota bacterium]